jgi:hypothetical protein
VFQALAGHLFQVEHLGELALFCFGVYCRWELIGVELREDDVDLDLAISYSSAARGPLLLRLGLCFDGDGRGLPLVLGEARLELFNLFAEARELVAVGGLAPRAQLAAAARCLERPGLRDERERPDHGWTALVKGRGYAPRLASGVSGLVGLAFCAYTARATCSRALYSLGNLAHTALEIWLKPFGAASV